MTTALIRSGTIFEALQPMGEWVFVDIGFAMDGNRSCGYLKVSADRAHENERAGVEMTHGDLTRVLLDLVQQSGPPLNLVIEAPLSSVFSDSGNPAGREGEYRDGKHRYWYEKAGCVVLIAGLYLIRAIHEAGPQREVRLFEGFVSFKDKGTPSNHLYDVEALRAAVFEQTNARIMEAAMLDCPGEGTVESTYSLLGLDRRPPPIIEVVAA